MANTTTAQNRPSIGRHRTDMVSLVSGVIFLGVVGTWLLDRIDVLADLRGWVLPLLLIAAGVIGLVGIRPSRPAAQSAQPADEDPRSAE